MKPKLKTPTIISEPLEPMAETVDVEEEESYAYCPDLRPMDEAETEPNSWEIKGELE